MYTSSTVRAEEKSAWALDQYLIGMVYTAPFPLDVYSRNALESACPQTHAPPNRSHGSRLTFSLVFSVFLKGWLQNWPQFFTSPCTHTFCQVTVQVLPLKCQKRFSLPGTLSSTMWLALPEGVGWMWPQICSEPGPIGMQSASTLSPASQPSPQGHVWACSLEGEKQPGYVHWGQSGWADRPAHPQTY